MKRQRQHVLCDDNWKDPEKAKSGDTYHVEIFRTTMVVATNGAHRTFALYGGITVRRFLAHGTPNRCGASSFVDSMSFYRVERRVYVTRDAFVRTQRRSRHSDFVHALRLRAATVRSLDRSDRWGAKEKVLIFYALHKTSRSRAGADVRAVVSRCRVTMSRNSDGRRVRGGGIGATLGSTIRSAVQRKIVASTKIPKNGTGGSKTARAKSSGTAGRAGTTSSPRKRTVLLTVREYLAYARTVVARHYGSDAPVHFPPVTDELLILRQLEANDASLLAPDSRFDDRFVAAVNSVFELNSRVSMSSVTRQFVGQSGSSASTKRWRESYLNDCRLGLFDRNIPFVVRVVVDREGEHSPFNRFARDMSLRPVMLNVARVLLGRTVLTSGDDSDSLTKAALRGLGIRSIYYRRIYVLHLLLWTIVCEGESHLSDTESS